MSSLPKRRRVKRATIVATRSQLAKNDLDKKRSYKPLCEKLKANNNALAKALSKEKQKCQYLFAEKIGLTREVQELKVACNERDDVISSVFKNAKDTLQLLVTMSNHVTNTIVSCQQLATTTRYTPRRLSTNDRRESSTRRLSGKSPARGVVQPMVSGHTIKKLTINLSSRNIHREYRVQNSPNLSDVEEGLTPAASPEVPARTSPDRLPERLRNSMRASDESERRSSVRSNRNSGRRSARSPRENSERLFLSPASPRGTQAAADAQSGECLRSPRVALHDVSRLLHKSPSVNIRTLMENSSDIDVTQAQQLSAVSRKSQNSSFVDMEDPLEGPSWLLNSSQCVSALGVSTSVSRINDESDEDDDEDDEQASSSSAFYKRLIDNAANNDDDDSSSNLSRFVTRKRGSDFDTREFSLMIDPEKRKKKYDFGHETVFDHTGLVLPMIGENPDSARPSRVLELNSDGEDARRDKRKLKRVYNKRANPPDSSSDPEWTPTRKGKNIKPKRKGVYKKPTTPPDVPSDSEVAPMPKPDSARPTTTVVKQESDEEAERSDLRKRKKKVYKKRREPARFAERHGTDTDSET